MLDELDREGNVDQLFNRYCQVTHLRALLLCDGGQRDKAIDLLQSLLIGTDRDNYNRAILWIIVDLAIILRARGNDGDDRQAESNFDNILLDIGSDSTRVADDGDHEPDPPHLLKLAKKAVTLVRSREFEQVDELLEKEKVDRAREQDLWLWMGGPAADTAWMKSL
jgi:hypothetical protein